MPTAMPTREDLLTLWNDVRGHLAKAHALLPDEPEEGPVFGGNLTALAEFLEHNELELALDELEHLGLANNCRGVFWSELLSAAELMGLSAHAIRYRAASSQ